MPEPTRGQACSREVGVDCLAMNTRTRKLIVTLTLLVILAVVLTGALLSNK